MSVKSYFKSFNNSAFGKNIALIVGGTAFAQFLGIVFSPLITRIYPPDQYGVLTAYTAILSLLVIAASFDYQKAIPIAEDDDEAISLLSLSLLFLISFVAIITILLYLKGELVLSLLNSEVLLKYKYLIPLGVLFTGVYNILLQWGFRKRDYKVISRTKVSQSITGNLVKIMLGIINFGPIGLILGVILGQSAGLTSLGIPIVKGRSFRSFIDVKQIKYVLKRYKNFPIFSAPSNYIYTAGSNIPIIFLVSLFGGSVTGLFGLAKTITQLPMSLIGTSVSQVFYSEAAGIGKNNPEKIKLLATKLTKRITIIALAPSLLLAVFGPSLFSFVFGKSWYEAGVYAQLLSFMVFFNFIITPIGRILEIFEKQQVGLGINIIRLILIVIGFIVSKMLDLNSYQTVGIYSFTNSVTYIVLLMVSFRIIDTEIKKNVKTKGDV